MFTLEAVSYTLPNKTLLHPIDLNIEHSEMVGLIGHNGSGKSTLLKLLARQLPVSSGRIALEGKVLKEWQDRAFARQVAYLPQQPPATDGLTVKELVRFGRYPWHGALGRFSREDQKQVERAMALTGIEVFSNRSVDELSGGERQRVWLAMLIAQNARFLLLDEPTSALDVAHQLDVLTLIRDLRKELEVGVVVVLHDINMAAGFCDRLVALHRGRMLTEGTPDQLMNQHSLRDIYGVNMSVMPHPHREGARIAVV